MERKHYLVRLDYSLCFYELLSSLVNQRQTGRGGCEPDTISSLIILAELESVCLWHSWQVLNSSLMMIM